MEKLKEQVLALPEVAAWPEMAGVFDNLGNKPRGDWELPARACQAVGGDPTVTLPGAAALACLQISIILVDDMLDDDPRGDYRRLGHGPTANLALAFQAAGFRLIERAPVEAGPRAAASASLAWMALATSLGQNWDVQNQGNERDYWTVVRAKSTPFYGAALHVGALLGQAAPSVADGLREFGLLLGEIIQIQDDLTDAFHTPAKPDWRRGRNNLAILYALTTDHPYSAQLDELLPRVDEPEALAEAQRLLIRCGAVSYCVYQLMSRYQQARRLLGGLALATPAPMLEVLEQQVQPVLHFLQKAGADLPTDLFRE